MHVMLQEGKHITFVLLVDNYFATIRNRESNV